MNSHTLAPFIGALFALTAALGFALWNLFMQRALRSVSVTGFLLSVPLYTTGLFLPIALWQSWQGTIPAFRPEGLISFALAGVMAGAVGPFHSALATRRIGATQTTALRLLDPFFAFVMGLLLLRERIAGTALIGVLLIVGGLWMLQRSQAGTASSGQMKLNTGILFAIGASIVFTVASMLRKIGLNVIPSPVLSVAMEGLVGLTIMVVATSVGRRWGEVKQALSWRHRDVLFSGLSAAMASLFLNLALQRLPLPVAVALRNTSPWFALLLAPLLLGVQHRAGWLSWVSTLLLTGGMLLILAR